jgi:Epoxide hydrolase N terminus
MSQPSQPLGITPFSIQVEEEVLTDLRARIHKTRWPDQIPGSGWEQGADLDDLRQMLRYWADEFDWRSHDFLLTNLTIYWATQTITPSMRDYFDNRWFGDTLGPADFVQVPSGIAVFAHQFADEGEPPREWGERLYNVRQWTPMPSGGREVAAEEPELLARDIATFFAAL